MNAHTEGKCVRCPANRCSPCDMLCSGWGEFPVGGGTKHALEVCLPAATVGGQGASLGRVSCRVDTHRAWPKAVPNQCILKDGKRNVDRWISGQIDKSGIYFSNRGVQNISAQ